MKFLILGHKRHGKDTVAEVLVQYSYLKFESSSQAANELFIFDALKEKYGYETLEECFEDRDNHREEWYNLITEYNREEPSRLAQEILKTNDIYVGMRSQRELVRCKELGLFDVIICVYDPRKEHEDEDSCDLDPLDEADVILLNQGTKSDIEQKTRRFLNLYQRQEF